MSGMVSPEVQTGQLADRAAMWMLTTYMDDSLRVSRDDAGRVFVMVKDVGLPADGAEAAAVAAVGVALTTVHA